MTFQGILKDSGGPINGASQVTFLLYDSEIGSAPLWLETQTITFENGYFSAVLGSAAPLNSTIFAGPEQWLGIRIGAAPELGPRLRMSSVPHAFQADTAASAANADLLDGLDSAAFLPQSAPFDGKPPICAAASSVSKFMVIPGIPGSVTQSGREDSIQVCGFEHSIEAPRDPGLGCPLAGENTSRYLWRNPSTSPARYCTRH